MKRVMVLLPTLNEEEGLAAVLPRLPIVEMSELGWESKILIVDGESHDSTAEVAQKSGYDVLQQQGKGKGAAMRLGFLHFLQSDCEGINEALFVFDQKYCLHSHQELSLIVIGFRLTNFGILSEKVEPSPSMLVTDTSPPWLLAT